MQQAKIFSVSDHDINPNTIDFDALFILSKLREAGFVAYLVGGSVRDLLLKRTPKDFDISTSARPEQIKQLFQRSCLLIGRRFRLAHIRIGHKIFEVSTFRSGENESDLIVQDNQWGTPEQDVLRRDFTINGLFYDPSTHSIIDYVGGWEDIHRNVLRTIGEPNLRFKQDPVRMLRLLKFRARFGFQITSEAGKALIQCREQILKSSPARVLEEILRMLESGAAAPFFSLMLESGLLSLLYPKFTQFMQGPSGNEAALYLMSADKMNMESGKTPLHRSILMACLLFPMLKHELKTKYFDCDKAPHIGEIIIAAGSVLHHFDAGAFAAFPRRLTAIMNGIMVNQYRLIPLSGKKHHLRMFRNKDFLEALTFLKIRALVDKSLIENYTSWKALYRQHIRQSSRKGHHPAPTAHEAKRSHNALH